MERPADDLYDREIMAPEKHDGRAGEGVGAAVERAKSVQCL